MKLKIRWKLLMLLLAVSLVPLAVVCLVVALTTRNLGREIAAEVRTQLVNSAQYELQRIIHERAASLDFTNRFIRFILVRQAEEVEKRLSRPRPADPPALWTAEQFDAADPPPPGLLESPQHERLNDDGTRTPLKVSFQTQVMRLAPEVDAQAVADDAARLADMTDVYRNLREAFPLPMLWQYTALSNGVHFSYPGKGGYPADYDPRQRLWFRLTSQADGPRWFPPTVDVTTGQLVLTIAAPLHRPDGSFAGVTAIDVAVTGVLSTSQIHAPWAADARQELVSIMEPRIARLLGLEVADEQPQALIFARSTPDQRGGDWRQPRQLELLACDDPSVIQSVRNDIAALRSGMREVNIAGRRHLWAYGPINAENPSCILLSVPYDRIIADADAMEDRILAQMWASLGAIGWVALAALAAIVVATWGGSHIVSQTVMHLAQTAQRVSEGNLDARMRVRSKLRDELSDMADAFNAMIPKLRDQLRMRHSLSLAMEVQQSLLPDDPPMIEGLDIAGHSQYCDETGGDYYDFIDLSQLGPRRLGVVIGDVVGHGIAAALLMATARALLHSRVSAPGTIEQVFGDVNQHLTDPHFSGRFMTLFYLDIDAESRTLRWMSAGHDPAILYHPADNRVEELAGQDVPLGIQKDWRFHAYQRDGWSSGDLIVLGTDGIWEARDTADRMFGKERLIELIRHHARSTADQIDAAIRQALVEFRGGREQLDDITLVVVKMA